MEPQLKSKIDGMISQYKVFVISKSYCPYCVKVINLLDSKGLPEDQYYVWHIENDPNMNAIQDYMLSLTGGRSVPRVFVNGKFIGGCDDTMNLEKSGKLKELLA